MGVGLYPNVAKPQANMVSDPNVAACHVLSRRNPCCMTPNSWNQQPVARVSPVGVCMRWVSSLRVQVQAAPCVRVA